MFAENHAQLVDDATAGVAGAAIAGGVAVRVDDAAADESFDPAVDYAAGYVVQSLICAPVVDGGGRAIGAVELLNRLRVEEDEEEVTPFDANDATALGLFAAIVGPCLERQLMADRHELWAGAAQ